MSAGQLIAVDFRQPASRPAGAPDPADSPLDYQDGDPVPDGWYVYEPGGPTGKKFLLYDWPYEQSTDGRLDALEAAVRSLRRRLAVAERRGGAR